MEMARLEWICREFCIDSIVQFIQIDSDQSRIQKRVCGKWLETESCHRSIVFTSTSDETFDGHPDLKINFSEGVSSSEWHVIMAIRRP
jgi:hypothetical protein